jgi:hypothetical protein
VAAHHALGHDKCFTEQWLASTCALLTIIIAGVLDEVVLQHAHQDGRQEAGQQQHRDAAVDDAEPVDLRCVEAQCYRGPVAYAFMCLLAASVMADCAIIT